MQALVLTDYEKLTVETRPEPSPKMGEVLIRVAAVGICGSDLHGYTGENGRRVPGQVMGHEAAGHIAGFGAGTDPGDLVLGQPVTFNPLISCCECAACRHGSQQHCPSSVVIGVDPTITAAFAEYLVVPLRNVHPLAPDAPISHGALVEPLAVAFNAVRRSQITPDSRLLVLGGGPIGQSIVLAAQQSGCHRIVVSEMSASRRQLCRSIGAETVDPKSIDLADHLAELWGAPADVAIDAVGISATMTDALRATAQGAVIALVGMGQRVLDINAYAVSTDERTITGSFCYSDDAFASAARWVAAKPPQLAALISKEVPLVDAPAAFAGLAAGIDTPGKIIITMGRP